MAARLGVALATLILGWTASAGAQTVVSIGANPPGSYTYSANAAIAKVFNVKTGLESRVQPYGGSSAYVPLLDSGELDLATLNVIESSMAVTGTGMFDGRKSPNIRAVTVLTPFIAAFFVRKDSPIKRVADLKGKSVGTGYVSQTTLVPIGEAILANAGMGWDDIRGVPVPNINRGADDFVAGKLDTFMYAFGAGKVREVDAQVGGVRAIGIDDNPQAIARMKKAVPQGYPLKQSPSPANTGVLEPGPFMAYDMLIVASSKTSDDIVYKFVKTMHDNKDELVAGFAALRAFEPKDMAKKLDPLEYHPGAIKFYKEVGIWPPKG